MAEKEEKFIVINRKFLENMILTERHFGQKKVDAIFSAIEDFQDYAENGAGIESGRNNKYIVCNQDEPYAEKVWQIILDGEDEKANDSGK